MDYHLLYTQRVLNDLAEIIGYIAGDDPGAASRFGVSLLDHVDLLPRFPRFGTVVRKRSVVRELLHGRVLVYCRADEDERLNPWGQGENPQTLEGRSALLPLVRAHSRRQAERDSSLL